LATMERTAGKRVGIVVGAEDESHFVVGFFGDGDERAGLDLSV